MGRDSGGEWVGVEGKCDGVRESGWVWRVKVIVRWCGGLESESLL